MRKYFHANISSVCVSDSSTKFITHENFYAYGTQFPACTGHAEEDKQVAFLQLCILLQKKGSSDVLFISMKIHRYIMIMLFVVIQLAGTHTCSHKHAHTM